MLEIEYYSIVKTDLTFICISELFYLCYLFVYTTFAKDAQLGQWLGRINN